MGHHQLLHLPSFGKKDGGEAVQQQLPKKGCMAIRVGQEGEEQQRFVVPVVYLNHPLFTQLLKEAEEVYGFRHEGAITIPCHVEYFRKVQDMIEKSQYHHHHHHHHHHHDNGSGSAGHHFHLTGCFGGLKAS